MGDKMKKPGKVTVLLIVVAVLCFSGLMWIVNTHIPGEDKMLDAIRQAEQQYGADHPKTASILSLAAAKYQLAGHPQKSIDVHKRIIAIDVKNSGKDSEIVVSSKHQLANLYDSINEHDMSDALFRDMCNTENRLVGGAVKQKQARAGETGKKKKAYKPMISPWLNAHITRLDEKENRDAWENEMIERYRSRLKSCDSRSG